MAPRVVMMRLLLTMTVGVEAYHASPQLTHRLDRPLPGRPLPGRPLPGRPLPGQTGLAAGQLCRAPLSPEHPVRATPPLMVRAASATAPGSKPTAVYALILLNLVSFLADKVLRMSFVRSLYLVHSRWAWWQPLTSCFCHADRAHLSGNLFLLLLFGRSVEDDLGWGGLLVAFAFCGIVANLISLLILPRMTISIGASGAVFGLFAVSTLAKLSWADLDWRKLVEVAVLGEFVVGKVLSEIRVSATGGVAGINHVAHLSGAAAGAAMVLSLRAAVARLEAREGK